MIENLLAEDLLKYMMNLFDNTGKYLDELNNKLSHIDMQLSDLDHYLEIHKLSGPQLMKLIHLRKKLRYDRRQVKDDIDIVNVIKKFTDKYNNKLITGDIIQTIKGIETTKQRQENPVYTYRTDIIKELEK